MPNTNTLNTRIRLRYDTYENWYINNPFLMQGEVAIAYVPVYSAGDDPENPNINYNTNNELTTQEPAILIKVGTGDETSVTVGGESMLASNFKALPFIQAKAADVYSWAKREHGRAEDIGVADTANHFKSQTKNVETILAELYTLIDNATGGNTTNLANLEAAITRLDGAADVTGSVANKIQNAVGTSSDSSSTNTIWGKINLLYDSTLDPYTSSYKQGSIAYEANAAISDTVNAVSTLVDEDYDKSVRTIASEEVAKIVNNADSSFDTLKEIADWIANDNTGAAKMGNDITALKTQAGLGSGQNQLTKTITTEVDGESVTQTVQATVKEYVDEKNTTLTSSITSATNRISTLENAVLVDCLILDCGSASSWQPAVQTTP